MDVHEGRTAGGSSSADILMTLIKLKFDVSGDMFYNHRSDVFAK